MATQVKNIQDEIEQAITRRKQAAAQRQAEEAQRKQAHAESLIAALRTDLGTVIDSLNGADIRYMADPDEDYAKAAISIDVDDISYTCYVTHAQNWTQFGVSRRLNDIHHYVSLVDLRNEILLTLIKQIEQARLTR